MKQPILTTSSTTIFSLPTPTTPPPPNTSIAAPTPIFLHTFLHFPIIFLLPLRLFLPLIHPSSSHPSTFPPLQSSQHITIFPTLLLLLFFLLLRLFFILPFLRLHFLLLLLPLIFLLPLLLLLHFLPLLPVPPVFLSSSCYFLLPFYSCPTSLSSSTLLSSSTSLPPSTCSPILLKIGTSSFSKQSLGIRVT